MPDGEAIARQLCNGCEVARDVEIAPTRRKCPHMQFIKITGVGLGQELPVALDDVAPSSAIPAGEIAAARSSISGGESAASEEFALHQRERRHRVDATAKEAR